MEYSDITDLSTKLYHGGLLDVNEAGQLPKCGSFPCKVLCSVAWRVQFQFHSQRRANTV